MKNIILPFIFASILFSQIDYESEIQPIFDVHCTHCHVYGGAATLNMSSYEGVMSGGVSGPAIIAGDHVNSLLYSRITLPVGTDGSMPPNNPLSQSEIDLIVQWINEGALLSISNVAVLPRKIYLHQNYPNPFNPITLIRYDLSEDAFVNITIYDMLGNVIKTLVDGSRTAGSNTVEWNATDTKNETVSAGLYVFAIQSGELKQTKKMLLVK